MKFVLASYGTRGDIEPSIFVGRELQRRGHTVLMAVPPDLMGFTESAGLETVAYGLDTKTWLDVYRNFWKFALHKFWRVGDIRRLWREMWELSDTAWAQMAATLKTAADGADVILAGQSYQEPAANVAEYHDIPLATLHHVPMRPNGQLVTFLPAKLGRWSMKAFDWVGWRLNKKVEDAQRRDLRLPRATGPTSRRITARNSLEIQAYDAAAFPGLAVEWAECRDQRPFVGALTMTMSTEADDEVAAWIATGTPPICFGFGSMPVESPEDTVEMISSACAELGERALVCAGWSDFSEVSHAEHVKVVGAVNYAAIFPLCRAVVHHGGSGTTAASMRAGVPTLVLSMDANQALWGGQIKKMKIGTTRRFSKSNRATMTQDLHRILDPGYATRARDLADRMTSPAESVVHAADVVEEFAGSRRLA
ncbi:glycosyl transferase family 1 [Mycolicibacterium chitae]|uniref:Glycosyl transferase family protein n=1 Tax=Mycolicibacterium chitae TaxID=1792 RepID=A0A448IDY2_MYCCI|nr:glycosyltransferase [Mycolicibacterium chitae]MCV7106041.1 glycosyltransferase [Mycolicibacterium chitae]BBZ01772.1 glycosyl transferase family 1 [Mycolicibacterium chitae]VEG50604.1 glycosyl transferase family protein [Mycolicibacterium chitae]